MDDLIVDKKSAYAEDEEVRYGDVEFFYPLLMVKDFDSKEFKVSDEFMTNADVPTLATEGSNAAGAIRKNFSGFTAAADPQAMHDELVRIFTEEDVKKIGQNARETIPLSWEKLIPMLLDRYQTVIDRYERTR